MIPPGQLAPEAARAAAAAVMVVVDPILGCKPSLLVLLTPHSLCGRAKASNARMKESPSERPAADDEVVELQVDRWRLRREVMRERLLSAVCGRPAAVPVASGSYICMLVVVVFDRVRGGVGAPRRVS